MFTAGIGTAIKIGAKALAKVVKVIIKILGKAVKVTLQALTAALSAIDDVIRAIKAMIAFFAKKGNKQVSKFFEKLEELFQKFKTFLKRKSLRQSQVDEAVVPPLRRKFDPKTATAKQKGNFGEIVSDTHLKQKHSLKRIGDKPPKTIDDKLRKGIDGIYENNSPPPKYVINESKYGQGKLNPNTADGPQMSDKWIENRLEKQLGPDKADEIIRAMKNGEADKVLSKVDESGNVSTFKLDKD